MSLIEIPEIYFNTHENLIAIDFLKECIEKKFGFFEKIQDKDDKIFNLIKNYLIWKIPEINQSCDACDKYNKWYNGKIIGCDGEFSYLIKFNSWSSLHNEWIDVRSRNIMPLFSNTINWRYDIQIGDSIEFLASYNKQKKIFQRRTWKIGLIVKNKIIDDKRHLILISLNEKSCVLDVENISINIEYPISIDSHDISKLGTHNKLSYYQKTLDKIYSWFDKYNIKLVKGKGLFKNDKLFPDDKILTVNTLINY